MRVLVSAAKMTSCYMKEPVLRIVLLSIILMPLGSVIDAMGSVKLVLTSTIALHVILALHMTDSAIVLALQGLMLHKKQELASRVKIHA